jgi:hypothetical protein
MAPASLQSTSANTTAMMPATISIVSSVHSAAV